MLTATVSALIALSTPAWRVAPQRHLEWDGAAYLPVGVSVAANSPALEASLQAGIRDFVVDLPPTGDWNPVLRRLEEAGARYFVRSAGLAPTPETLVVEPESYRVTEVVGPFQINVQVPGADRALVLLVGQTSGNIRWRAVLPVENGRLAIRSEQVFSTPHALLIYPVIREAALPDLWDGWDEARDRLLGQVNEASFGPGMRGWIDPMGQITGSPAAESGSVPLSPRFRLELAETLRVRYSTLPAALLAWGLTANDVRTFDELAEMIPLWNRDRGVGLAWRPSVDRVYRVELGRSAMWRDLRSVVQTTQLRRSQRLAEQLRRKTPVPILSTWHGWGGVYETASSEEDGLVFRSSATTLTELLDEAARPVSTTLRRSRPTFSLATDLASGDGEKLPRPEQVVSLSESMGVRGWFFRAENAPLAAIAGLASNRAANPAATFPPRVLYFPEAARNPATATLVTPGVWWLPGPGAGDRIDFGEGIDGYRYVDRGETLVVMWAKQDARRVRFAITGSPEAYPVEPLELVELRPRARRNEIELFLPTSPIVWRNPPTIPVPIESFQVTTALIDTLIRRFPSVADPGGSEKFEMANTSQAFARTPGEAFLKVRQQFRRVMLRCAPFRWIEAESSTRATLGTALPIPGTSGGRALVANNRLLGLSQVPFAHYDFNVPTATDAELWIAASIPDAIRPEVKVRMGDTVLNFPEFPVSRYADGFGWYRLGQVRLTPGQRRLTLEAPRQPGAIAQFDAIMISPAAFQPDGARPPVAWLLDLITNPPRP